MAQNKSQDLYPLSDDPVPYEDGDGQPKTSDIKDRVTTRKIKNSGGAGLTCSYDRTAT